MFEQIQRQFLTDCVSCHSPNWVSRDGIDLAEGVPASGNRDSDPTVK
jgi:mono/diheme cytochrome c family protein